MLCSWFEAYAVISKTTKITISVTCASCTHTCKLRVWVSRNAISPLWFNFCNRYAVLSARFRFSYFRFSNVVKQWCFSVINMTHYCDNRRSWLTLSNFNFLCSDCSLRLFYNNCFMPKLFSYKTAVSWSNDWLTVAITPNPIIFAIKSEFFNAIWPANSATVLDCLILHLLQAQLVFQIYELIGCLELWV